MGNRGAGRPGGIGGQGEQRKYEEGRAEGTGRQGEQRVGGRVKDEDKDKSDDEDEDA